MNAPLRRQLSRENEREESSGGGGGWRLQGLMAKDDKPLKHANSKGWNRKEAKGMNSLAADPAELKTVIFQGFAMLLKD